MKTKIDIVSGFLGSGKTTLIRKLISEKYKDEKVVVLENELGKINIDGQILKNSGVIVKELTAGCICCNLSGNFDDAVIEILETFKPDRIIVEPTGIALLSQVINSCTSNKCFNLIQLNMVITVVDVKRFKLSYSYSKGFLENQIRATQSIILSKTEEVDYNIVQETIDKLREINRNATIINLPWDKVTAAELLYSVQYTPIEKTDIKNEKLKIVSGKQRLRIEECAIETTRKFTKEKIKNIFFKLEKVSLYGTIIRGKGLVPVNGSKGLKFDYVPGDLTFELLNPQSLGKICIIGMNLNKDKIKELFMNFQ